jgi:hypothetical protein
MSPGDCEMSNAKTVSELTDEWIALLQSSGEETALGFYCEYIMPELLPTLRKKFRETYGHEPHYDGLISLLGFAPDTVILASQFVKPETLVVLHTEETKDFLDRVYSRSVESQHKTSYFTRQGYPGGDHSSSEPRSSAD